MHEDGYAEKVPYFCLPADQLTDVIAPSCYSCFDYSNALADVVVGYMGVPFEGKDVPMTKHFQYATIRNARGQEMWDLLSGTGRLQQAPATREGSRKDFVLQTLVADDEVQLGKASSPLPLWAGNILADVLEAIGPKGLEFAQYSIDYHFLRNYLNVRRRFGRAQADRHIPEYARRTMAPFEKVLEERLAAAGLEGSDAEVALGGREDGRGGDGQAVGLIVGAAAVVAALGALWVMSG